MAQWTDKTPGDGEMSGLTSIATTLETEQQEASDLVVALGNVIEAVPSYWTGEAAEAWTALVTEEHTDLGVVQASSTTVAGAIKTYVDLVKVIKEDEEKQQKIIKDANAETKRVHKEQKQLGPHTGATIKKWEKDLDDAAAAREDANKALKGLGDDRLAADKAFVASTSGAIPSTWAAEKKALAAIGITNPMEMTEKHIADTIEKLAKKIIDNKDATPAPTKEQWDALRKAFTTYQHDEQVMSKVFKDLGGENTATLVALIGEKLWSTADPNTASDWTHFAQAMRTGLSEATQNWPAGKKTTQFIDELLDPMNGGTGGYFFDGPPWMGPEFTAAAAAYIDKYEREDPKAPYVVSGSEFWAMALAMAEAKFGKPAADVCYPDDFVWYDSGTPEGSTSFYDVAGRIFQTLAQYPDKTAEFFDTATNKRVSYWYGTRDWSTHDHFEGPAALWEATQYGAKDSTLPKASKAAMELTSKIMKALAGNPAFKSEALTAEAAQDFADALTANMAGLTEGLLNGFNASNFESSRNAQNYNVLNTGATAWGPAITEDIFEKLLGVIGANDTGATAIWSRFATYADALFGLSNGTQDPQMMRNATDRVQNLLSSFAGSVKGTVMEEALNRDAEAQAAIDMVEDILDYIPYSEAVKVTSAIAEFIRDTGFNMLEAGILGGWSEAMTGNAEAAAPKAGADFDASIASAKVLLINALLNAGDKAPVGDVPELNVPSGASEEERQAAVEEYAEKVNQWVEDNRPQIDDWMGKGGEDGVNALMRDLENDAKRAASTENDEEK